MIWVADFTIQDLYCITYTNINREKYFKKVESKSLSRIIQEALSCAVIIIIVMLTSDFMPFVILHWTHAGLVCLILH